ncbi:MAG TPA: hypothetical protein VFV33_05020, partial [Gemmatimonadaceae bacterium]|nr:hypothetical protein [Gemmatimonadaceae bacterium]
MGLAYTLFVKPLLVLAVALALLAGVYLLPEYWPDHRVASDAMRRDDAAKLRLYLQRGLDPDDRSQWRSGTRRMLDRVSRAPIGTSDYGDAPEPLLAEAVGKCKVEFAEILMEAGADVNARAANGYSILSQAALCDRPALVQSMLRRGADARAAEPNGETVLWERGLQGWRRRPVNAEVVRMLEAA